MEQYDATLRKKERDKSLYVKALSYLLPREKKITLKAYHSHLSQLLFEHLK